MSGKHIARTQAHLDGWMSLLTNIGRQGYDKRMSFNVTTPESVSKLKLDNLWRGDWLAKRIVKIPPRDMTRKWIQLDKGVDPEIGSGVMNELWRLGVREKFRQAAQWARLYGGSAIVMIIEDGGDPDEPVDRKRLKRIRGMFVLDRYQIEPYEINDDPESQYFGQPETYKIKADYGQSARSGGSVASTGSSVSTWGTVFHRDRVLRFDGEELTNSQLSQNEGWGDSVLLSIYSSALRNFTQSHDAAASIIADIIQPVISIKDLMGSLGADKDNLILERLSLMNYSRSILNAWLLDANDEEFKNVTADVRGMKDLLDVFKQDVIASSEIPHTILFGESPSGLGATGASEEGVYYDLISSMQESMLRPPLDYVIELTFNSDDGPTKGKEPEYWDYSFVSLQQESPKEQAEARLTQAKADEIYLKYGVVSRLEMANSRFGGGDYSYETTIDDELRVEFNEPDPDEDGDDI